MSRFTIDQKRIQTMRERLGEASSLITAENERYLPLFRNRQKNYAKEFKQAVKMARAKKNPARWFASIWGVEKTKKTVEILRAYINKKISVQAEKREQARRNAEVDSVVKSFNEAGRNKYRMMMIERGLITS